MPNAKSLSQVSAKVNVDNIPLDRQDKTYQMIIRFGDIKIAAIHVKFQYRPLPIQKLISTCSLGKLATKVQPDM